MVSLTTGDAVMVSPISDYMRCREGVFYVKRCRDGVSYFTTGDAVMVFSMLNYTC